MRRTVASFIGHCSLFAPIVWLLLLRLRFDGATRLVCLSDGAQWIRDLVNSLPLRIKPILILDFYHVVMRVRETLRKLHGDRSAEYERLSRIWCDAIREGEVDWVIRDLEELKSKCESAADLLGYFKNNRDRMAYASYVAQKREISSAPVESANYHVTGARLKQQGMRWTPEAAHEMAVLRADLCNDQWRKRTRQLLKLAA